MSKSKKSLNGYFKLILDAKKNGKKSFQYNGKIYVGKTHPNLGMIYKLGGGASPALKKSSRSKY